MHVVLIGNLVQHTGGKSEFDLAVGTVRQLFDALSDLYPGVRPHLETGIAVAINGEIYQDALLEPIPPDSEVHLLPQIGGGSG